MKDKIIGFIPDIELEAKENLERFIENSKKLIPQLIHEKYPIKWEDPIWYIGDSFNRETNYTVRLYFTTEPTGKSHKKSLVGFKESFSNFTKSYIIEYSANSSNNLLSYITNTLRFIYFELCDSFPSDPCITKIKPDHLERAAVKLRTKYTNDRTYGMYAYNLNQISNFINENFLVNQRFRWKTKLPNIRYANITVSEKARAERHNKLPDEETLLLVAEAFHKAQEPTDKLITSIMALLSIAPSRISEIFRLPKDIYVQRTFNGKTVHEMRWLPAKGGKPVLKSIPDAMIDVFNKAYSQIHDITKDAREIAKWYEKNPDKLYLPKHLEYLRENPDELKPLKYFEDLTWKDSNTPNSIWFKNKKVEMVKLKGRTSPYHTTFSNIEKALLELLPTYFPYTDSTKKLKFSDALIVVPYNFLAKNHSHLMIGKIASDHLGKLISGVGGYGGIFQRLGMKKKDGSEVKITSHQFRHWLNTLAHETGELSQEAIAIWSGRANIHHNIAYDHSDKDELLNEFKALLEDEESTRIGITTYKPVSKEEFARIKDRPPVHATKYGFCLHDYSFSPCQKFMDCLNCSESCFIKGLKNQEDNLRFLMQTYSEELGKAEEKIKQGEMDSENNWYRSSKKAHENLTGIIDIMDDKDISDGTPMMIQARDEYDPITNACESRLTISEEETVRNALENNKNEMLFQELKELTDEGETDRGR